MRQALRLPDSYRSVAGHTGGDVGALRKSSAERDILAGNLVNQDAQIVRGDPNSLDHTVIQLLQERQTRLLRPTNDEGDLQENKVLGVGQS